MTVKHSIFLLPDEATKNFTEALSLCDFPFARVTSRVSNFPVRWSNGDFPYSGLYDGVYITEHSLYRNYWEATAITQTILEQRNYGKRIFVHEVAHMLDYRVFLPDGLRPALHDIMGRQTYGSWVEGNYSDQGQEAFANAFVAAFAPKVFKPTDAPISPGLFPNTDPAVVPKIRALLLEKYPLVAPPVPTPNEDDVRIERVTVPITKTFNGRGHGTMLSKIPVDKIVSVMVNSGYDAATGKTQPLPKVAFNNYAGTALFEVQEAGTGGSVDLIVSVKET